MVMSTFWSCRPGHACGPFVSRGLLVTAPSQSCLCLPGAGLCVRRTRGTACLVPTLARPCHLVVGRMGLLERTQTKEGLKAISSELGVWSVGQWLPGMHEALGKPPVPHTGEAGQGHQKFKVILSYLSS